MIKPERARRLFAGIALSDDVRAACAAVAGRLRIAGFEARDRRGSSRQNVRFRDLAQAVRDGCRRLGCSFDADPAAHVTIARVKAPARPLPMLDVAPIPVAVAALTLFESRFDKPEGRSHEEVLQVESLG